MRKLFFFTFYFFCSISISFCQNSQNESFKIPLRLILPENLDQLNSKLLSSFNSKITDIVTNTGLSGSENSYSSFLIYPKINIQEAQVVETGMKKLYNLTIEISLIIKEYESQIIFASTTFNVEGFGNSKDIAVSKAINTININTASFDTFISTAKSKIIKYYNTTCNTIISKAITVSKSNDFPQAISLLYSIPMEVDCHQTAQKYLIDFYKSYQNRVCNLKIQDAKTKIANRSFSEAMGILSTLDPLTACKSESDKLIAICAKQVSEQELRNYNESLMRYKNETELEKKRIDAIKDIAVEYYRSQPQTIIYNRLIIF